MLNGNCLGLYVSGRINPTVPAKRYRQSILIAVTVAVAFRIERQGRLDLSDRLQGAK
jgi:hypothetical protein